MKKGFSATETHIYTGVKDVSVTAPGKYSRITEGKVEVMKGGLYRIKLADRIQNSETVNLVFHAVVCTDKAGGCSNPCSPGDKGLIGDKGATGSAGPVGLTGDKGETGDKGATGATGADGGQGSQGIQGPIGPVGPTGPQGLIDNKGPNGDRGPAGPTGAHVLCRCLRPARRAKL
jgi:hypothetical protein